MDYRISEWFDQAVRGVLHLPLYLFSEKVHRFAHPDAMAHISDIKHKIIRSRLLLVNSPPVSDECRLCVHQNCCAKWLIMWNELAVPILLKHFDRPILVEEMQELEALINSQRTCCEHCNRANMAVVREMRAGHEQLIQSAVDDWRTSIRFSSIEAAIEGIRRRSDRGPYFERGRPLENNLSFLSLCSGLGVYSD